jgi:Sigma-70, region 4
MSARPERRPTGPPPQRSRAIEELAARAGMSPGSELDDGLAALPEPQRQALLLTCYGGYTQDQAADLLGLPASTVSALTRDGLRWAAAERQREPGRRRRVTTRNLFRPSSSGCSRTGPQWRRRELSPQSGGCRLTPAVPC